MASMRFKFGHEEVGKTSIAVQGLGHIGMELVKLLRDRGAKLYVTDLDSALVDRAVSDFGAEAVKPDEIHEVNADVFAPCALEGAINADTLPRIKARSSAAPPTTSCRAGNRRRTACARHPVCAGLCGQCWWRDERVAGDRRLQPRTRDAPDPQPITTSPASSNCRSARTSRRSERPTASPKAASCRSAN